MIILFSPLQRGIFVPPSYLGTTIDLPQFSWGPNVIANLACLPCLPVPVLLGSRACPGSIRVLCGAFFARPQYFWGPAALFVPLVPLVPFCPSGSSGSSDPFGSSGSFDPFGSFGSFRFIPLLHPLLIPFEKSPVSLCQSCRFILSQHSWFLCLRQYRRYRWYFRFLRLLCLRQPVLPAPCRRHRWTDSPGYRTVRAENTGGTLVRDGRYRWPLCLLWYFRFLRLL